MNDTFRNRSETLIQCVVLNLFPISSLMDFALELVVVVSPYSPPPPAPSGICGGPVGGVWGMEADSNHTPKTPERRRICPSVCGSRRYRPKILRKIVSEVGRVWLSFSQMCPRKVVGPNCVETQFGMRENSAIKTNLKAVHDHSLISNAIGFVSTPSPIRCSSIACCIFFIARDLRSPQAIPIAHGARFP